MMNGQGPVLAGSRWGEQLTSVAHLAQELEVDTVVLRDPLNLSWFTGARWNVPLTLNASCFDVVITNLGQHSAAEVRVVTNAIEAPRLRDTEFAGQDVDFDVVPWMENRAYRLPAGQSVATDVSDGASVDAQEDIAGFRRILSQRQRSDLTDLSTDLARITGIW